MNIIKKITFLLFSCMLFLNMQISAKDGGAIAGGIIAGAAIGSAIAATADDRPVVYPAPAYDPYYDPYYYGGVYTTPVIYEEGPYYHRDGYRYRGTRDGKREYRGTRGGQQRSSRK